MIGYPSSLRPSACELPTLRVRFLTPHDGEQQATWHCSWRNNPGLVMALRGEQTPEARQWAQTLSDSLAQFFAPMDCTVLGIELVGSHTLELEGEPA